MIIERGSLKLIPALSLPPSPPHDLVSLSANTAYMFLLREIEDDPKIDLI